MYDVARTLVDDRLRAAERRRLVREAAAHRDAGPRTDPSGAASLRRLLGEAGELGLGEGAAWSGIRTEAASVTASLADDGALPPHLVVAEDERPVVLVRLLATALRRLRRVS